MIVMRFLRRGGGTLGVHDLCLHRMFGEGSSVWRKPASLQTALTEEEEEVEVRGVDAARGTGGRGEGCLMLC